MKVMCASLLLFYLLLSPAHSLFAGTNDIVIINYNVDQVCSVALSDSVASVAISSSSSDGDYIEFTNNVLSMSLTSNVTSRKIIASLSESMVDNTWLYMTVSVPPGWTSSGETLLTTAPAVLAYGGAVVQGGMSISIRFRAYVMAGPVSRRHVTINMTITDNT